MDKIPSGDEQATFSSVKNNNGEETEKREVSEEEEETEYVQEDGENSVDDEATLEEEEMLDNDRDIAEEVAELQEDQDIPIDELLRLYGYGNSQQGSRSNNECSDVSEDISGRGQGNTLSPTSSSSNCNQETIAASRRQERYFGHPSTIGNVPGSSSTRAEANAFDGEDGSAREHGYFSTSDEDSENDFDYVPEESWRKDIKIGPEYQADIPACSISSKTDELSAVVDNPDELQWFSDPLRLTEETVEAYLRSAYLKKPVQTTKRKANPDTGIGGTDSSAGSHEQLLSALPAQKRRSQPPVISASTTTTSETNDPYAPQQTLLRDDEVALKLLTESHYDVDAALTKILTKWSEQRDDDAEKSWKEEDQNAFEEGLKTHGKNFRLIQHEFFPNRTVGELVQYYYLWKRTERHDVFVQTYRFEKRHYGLHPTATDYMDHFLDHVALVGAPSTVAPLASAFQSGSHQHHHHLDNHNHHLLHHNPYTSLMASATSSRLHIVSSPPYHRSSVAAEGAPPPPPVSEDAKDARNSESANGNSSKRSRSSLDAAQ